MIAVAFKTHFLKLVSQEFLENIVPLHYLMMRLFVISIFLKLVVSAPYEPGQPGGEWTAEEIDIVRGKVIPYFSIFSQNKFPLLLMEKSITLISNFKVTIFYLLYLLFIYLRFLDY